MHEEVTQRFGTDFLQSLEGTHQQWSEEQPVHLHLQRSWLLWRLLRYHGTMVMENVSDLSQYNFLGT